MEDMVNDWGAIERVFEGRSVLVTGHTGFKGAWLSLWLTRLGAKVIGYSLEPEGEEDNLHTLNKSKTEETSYYGDINDSAALSEIVQLHRPEIVFHLAAQALVRQSYVDPIETYRSNVLGTLNLLNIIRCTDSVRCIVNVTTDKVYENREWPHPYRESDRLGGHDPYSASKACVELMSASFFRSFLRDRGVSMVNARAGNVIGGGDFSCDRLIPDFVRALKVRQELIIRSPMSVRPWQHVLDALSGYLLLAGSLLNTRNPATFDEIYAVNLSPEDGGGITVESIVKQAIAAFGQGSYRVDESCATVHEAKQLRLDSSLFRSTYGWEPVLTQSQSVDWTIAWYKEWLDGGDPLELCHNELQKFSKLKMNQSRRYQ